MWSLATLSLLLFSLCLADEHNMVIPLTYEPQSRLVTASISIGNPANSYTLYADTGSPFLFLQNSLFRRTSSTFDPDMPDLEMGPGAGFITTDPDDGSGGPVQPKKMHYLTDTAWFNEGELGGMVGRAGGGAKSGNATIVVGELEGLGKAQGLLGMGPPLSNTGDGFKNAKEEQEGKKKKRRKRSHPSTPPSPKQGQLPSLDPTFLHSFFSPSFRQKMGITGASHFYLALNPAGGELVLPLSTTDLPTDRTGYDYDKKITIDPASGAIFPKLPFWGVAHNPSLGFLLDDTQVMDVRVDAVMFDSGTTGIIGPLNEVGKLFNATAGRVDGQILHNGTTLAGKVKCGEKMRLGMQLGEGKNVYFDGVRQNSQGQGDGGKGRQLSQASHTALDWGQQADAAQQRPISPWKNMVSQGIESYLQGLGNFFHILSPVGKKQKRTLDFGMLQLGTAAPQKKKQGEMAGDYGEGVAGETKDCDATVIGSHQVELMFLGNGPNLKVWILGIEWFMQYLVYFNVDDGRVVIVPRSGLQ